MPSKLAPPLHLHVWLSQLHGVLEEHSGLEGVLLTWNSLRSTPTFALGWAQYVEKWN